MGFSKNTCIVMGSSSGYQSTGGVSNRAPPGHGVCGTAKCCPRCCGGVDKSFVEHVGSNVICSKDGHMEVCGLPFDKWQDAGNDINSTISTWPADDHLVAEAKALLGMPGVWFV